jgi:hypothetical protein
MSMKLKRFEEIGKTKDHSKSMSEKVKIKENEDMEKLRASAENIGLDLTANLPDFIDLI